MKNELQTRMLERVHSLTAKPESSTSRVLVDIEDTCLLLDISGSMARSVESGFRSSYNTMLDRLKEEVKKLNWKGHVWAFSVQASEINIATVELLHTETLTYMGNAIRSVVNIGKMKRAIMVTDGDASDPEDTLKALKETGLQLEIIFITRATGSKQDIPDFLNTLAAAAGTTVQTQAMNARGQLSNSIKGLLGPSTSSAIQL